MSNRKIEKVCMELIRPISLTPNHLRCYEFSFLDQMAFPISVHFALFYPSPCSGNQFNSNEQIKAINSSRLLVLKKSLSKTLATFYPFAVRIKDNSIECNDDGVPFYEAFAQNYKLEDVLRQTHIDTQFFPTLDDQQRTMLHIPLLVQVTLFECGGMSISIHASNKIVDLATLCTLVNAWAVTTRGSFNCVDVPEFVSAAKFLPHPIPSGSQSNWSNTISSGSQSNWSNTIGTVNEYFDYQLITKLFIFDASTIASLKAKVVCDAVPTPTRVDVVSAVIWKCFMKAVASTRTSSSLIFNVNIRKRLVPPLPNHCVGNVVAVATSCKGEDDGYDLPTLVASIRKGLSELSSKYVDKLKQDEAILAIPKESINLGFAHLKDSGGIDASVCLMEKEMEAFQHEILDVLAIDSAT